MGKEEDQTNFLRREIACLKEQHHENIVEWLHTIETTTDLYTSLEFCAGKTIGHLIHDEHQIKEPVAQFFFVQILSAIVYLHGKSESSSMHSYHPYPYM